MNASDLLVETLLDSEVDAIFGQPGEKIRELV